MYFRCTYGSQKLRYIQTAVSNEDHKLFTQFARLNDITLGELVEAAVLEYIRVKSTGKEEVCGVVEVDKTEALK
jgi:hypothetical protein